MYDCVIRRLLTSSINLNTYIMVATVDRPSNHRFADDSGGSDSEREEAFVKGVTTIVQKLLREADRNKKDRLGAAAFEAHQVKPKKRWGGGDVRCALYRSGPLRRLGGVQAVSMPAWQGLDIMKRDGIAGCCVESLWCG